MSIICGLIYDNAIMRVRPRIVSLCFGTPLEKVGDAVVHLAASDDHDSVCAVRPRASVDRTLKAHHEAHDNQIQNFCYKFVPYPDNATSHQLQFFRRGVLPFKTSATKCCSITLVLTSQSMSALFG